MLMNRIRRIFARDRARAGGGPRPGFVSQVRSGPCHCYYSGLVAFRSRDGLLTNRLQRSCIHGTYFTLFAWCRLSPTPPGGPSEGHGYDGGAGAVRGGWDPEVAGGADPMAPSDL